MIDIVAWYRFGVTGDARPLLRGGWSHLEAEFTWTIGPRSKVLLPHRADDRQVLLEISLNPLLLSPVLRKQRVVIRVNGEEVADETLFGECSLGLPVPTRATEGATVLDIDLECPTSVVPSSFGASLDDRQLGVAVREMLVFKTDKQASYVPRVRAPLFVSPDGIERAVRGLTGLALPDLAARFESIGHNCEFGLVQRAMGAEGLGLLRMGGLPVRRLIEGLDLAFEGVDVPGNLVTYLSDPSLSGDPNLREFMVRDIRYETNYHTNMTDRDVDADEVLRIFYRHLSFLRRKFVEDLESCHKIFVFQHPVIRSVAQVRPILNILRSYGKNTLLFATDNSGQPPGSVEQLDEDLFHGRMLRLPPGRDNLAFNLPSWISICANTYRLWRESGRGE